MKKPAKKPGKGRGKPERRDRYTVVLEDLRDKFRAFGDGLMMVDEKVDRGFKEIDERFDKVDGKLNSHAEMIAQLLLDTAEIKHNMVQKVDRSEFARLEKRVLTLERRVRS